MVNHINADSLPIVESDEFLPPIGNWARLGSLVIVAGVGIAIALASIIEYKVTVKGQGSIRPTGELRIVQAATEGQVTKVFVKENQPVKKGDLLATIDDSSLQTQKSQLQNNIQQTQLQLLQIDAQVTALNRQIQAETEGKKRAVTSAEAALNRAQRNYRDQQINVKSEVEEAEANLKRAQNELTQAQVELRSARANLQSTEAAVSAAQAKRDRYQKVVQAGALSLNQLEEVQLDVAQQQHAVEVRQATVEAQQQIIAQQQQAVAAMRAKLQRVQTALNPIDAEVAIAQENIAQESASGQATLAILNREWEALFQQRIQIKNQIQRDTRELQQVESNLSQTKITVTEDGIISQLNLRNSGQSVRVGEEIAQIFPSNAPLVIKAAVSPDDVSKLAKDQKVQMRVSACPYPDYGTLKGFVSQISEDTVKSPGNQLGSTVANASSPMQNSTSSFYEVTIVPESLFLGKTNHECTIQPGMQGRVDIISRSETVLKFLLRKARLIADW
ncbi:biotin/lipoyl-binding protein [Nodularia sphaerocarpa]|uniref:HlyD family efflux transporter periplasmic adaptor subunit n=1 Tax=Nodularia sphaerocarpa TaxID=137816 RepID=UPI001EFA8253|nr:biotin/lipoyl-binding protein [Nodularia sphaerocarpa]MDB9373346.1 HlyD family efflux transporter periplasmic adaptor subunit [Nodularia sphaerocarpa CS-585]MDB9379355.1 HlyD family efflux transporter periplasmic adaptor subunit [Nodularia sphaerocarpa CS-585A2]ULP71936.1 Hemolysin secretion protein D, chromosomal [Nodularia sphaerocarpa UHCC 0038]